MNDWLAVGYLIAATLFIVGLKGLGRPRSAVRGNQLSALGMLVAVVVTVVDDEIVSYGVIAAGLAIGTVVGSLLATRVRMTAMPELVALFNGFGGAASVFVAAASFLAAGDTGSTSDQVAVASVLAALIGSMTFTGSVLAFAKLRESLNGGGFAGLRLIHVLLGLAAIGCAVMMVVDPESTGWIWVLAAIGAALGVSLVLPIGGADMPVVIALLNSMSGLAASAAGFVLDNPLLIIGGALVGASGVILTQIMCVAMNRSLLSVVFGEAPTGGGGDQDEDVYAGKVRSTSAEDVAMMLDASSRVVVVPGYGLAVAQAQHAVRDLTRQLQDRGVEVVFGIHPVAGRMPGHMNVLLAEAEIDYEHLVEMTDVNPTFEQTDVTIVLGANDVVNPAARTDPSSPIAGMPILDVDKSRVVVVIKRSLSPGFAGIPNPLFAAENTLMLFGDGKAAIADISKAVAAT